MKMARFSLLFGDAAYARTECKVIPDALIMPTSGAKLKNCISKCTGRETRKVPAPWICGW